jgi:hypothetical protein
MRKMLIAGILVIIAIVSIGLVTAGNGFGSDNGKGECDNVCDGEGFGPGDGICDGEGTGECNGNCKNYGEGNGLCNGQCDGEQNNNQFEKCNCYRSNNPKGCCRGN